MPYTAYYSPLSIFKCLVSSFLKLDECKHLDEQFGTLEFLNREDTGALCYHPFGDVLRRSKFCRDCGMIFPDPSRVEHLDEIEMNKLRKEKELRGNNTYRHQVNLHSCMEIVRKRLRRKKEEFTQKEILTTLKLIFKKRAAYTAMEAVRLAFDDVKRKKIVLEASVCA